MKKVQNSGKLSLNWFEFQLFKQNKFQSAGQTPRFGLNPGFSGKKFQNSGKLSLNWIESSFLRKKVPKPQEGSGVKSNELYDLHKSLEKFMLYMYKMYEKI